MIEDECRLYHQLLQEISSRLNIVQFISTQSECHESRHEIDSELNFFYYLVCPFMFKYICHLMSVLHLFCRSQNTKK